MWALSKTSPVSTISVVVCRGLSRAFTPSAPTPKSFCSGGSSRYCCHSTPHTSQRLDPQPDLSQNAPFSGPSDTPNRLGSAKPTASSATAAMPSGRNSRQGAKVRAAHTAATASVTARPASATGGRVSRAEPVRSTTRLVAPPASASPVASAAAHTPAPMRLTRPSCAAVSRRSQQSSASIAPRATHAVSVLAMIRPERITAPAAPARPRPARLRAVNTQRSAEGKHRHRKPAKKFRLPRVLRYRSPVPGRAQ